MKNFKNVEMKCVLCGHEYFIMLESRMYGSMQMQCAVCKKMLFAEIKSESAEERQAHSVLYPSQNGESNK